MTPSSSLPTAPFLSSPLATASDIAGTVSAKQLAWQTIAYLVVVLVIVAVITSTILLIWNESQILAVIREHLAGESVGAETEIHLSPIARIASVLVLRMQRYFFTTLLPAFPSFRRANAASLGNTTRRSRPVLPRFGPSGSLEQEHQLATLPPLILHDSRSHGLFRVPSNPGSVIALSSPTASRSFLGQVSAP